ncbi:IS3 family transposase OrfB [Escherichia coli]|nr:IS3 family transposase OrfB [Escherichia coli]
MKSWPYSKGSDILRETPEMKYVFIEKHQAEFSIQAMCRVPAAAGICGIGGGQG